jgi:hypothetical protein
MKNYIFIIAAFTLVSLNVHCVDSKTKGRKEHRDVKITLPNGEVRYLSQEKIRQWIQKELQTHAAPMVKIESLTELFDFIIAAKKQDFLGDIKLSKISILIDQLKDAIRKEEQLMPHVHFDEKRVEKINQAKNKIKELHDSFQSKQ